MIILATFAVCSTVTMRTHAEKITAEKQLTEITGEVAKLRTTNEALRREVNNLGSDPRTIETFARARLKMVRANEVVIPLE